MNNYNALKQFLDTLRPRLSSGVWHALTRHHALR
jgi:hypothetical protein